MLLPSSLVHPSWEPFFNEEVAAQLSSIWDRVQGDEITPSKEKALRFLSVNLNGVKVIPLGQDPYFQLNVATGRSFEVGTLRNWDDPRMNASLRNILKAIAAAYTGKVEPIARVRAAINEGRLKLPPVQEAWGYWEAQGVLWLNVSFTTRVGVARAHYDEWRGFGTRVLQHIRNVRGNEVLWYLWGNDAQALGEELLP